MTPPRKGSGSGSGSRRRRSIGSNSPTRDRDPKVIVVDSPSRRSPTRSSAVFDFTSVAAAEEGVAAAAEPRSFPYSIKQQCWDKAEKVKGRDPDRWRRDAAGNLVFRKLAGCQGCLCYDYDHIIPYSKGGKSTLENCQVLQAHVNKLKGNRTEISKSDLIKNSVACRVAGREMDLIEHTAYGNLNHAPDSGGCRIQ